MDVKTKKERPLRPSSLRALALVGTGVVLLVISACAAVVPGKDAVHGARVRPIETRTFGTYDVTIAKLRQAHEAHPDDLDLTLALARNLRYAGKVDAAGDILGHVPEAERKDGRFLGELGAVRLAQGDIPGGLAALKDGEAENPENWRILASLGVANDLAGAHASAQAAFEKALALCPGNAAIMNNLAVSQALSGNLDGAVATLRRALATGRHHRQIVANLNAFLDIKGRCPDCGAARLGGLSAAFFTPSPDAVGGDAACTKVVNSSPGAPSFSRLTDEGATAPSVDIQVHFRFDSAVLEKDAEDVLNALGRTLSSPALRGARFEIAGHTDAVGSAAYNQVLSRLRAEAVKSYLVAHFSIAPGSLVARGFGETQLIDPRHPDGAVNRRVRVTRLSSAPM